MFDRVVVGVDGRQGGRDAIALAEQLAAPSAEVTLAHVYAGNASVYRSASTAYEAGERARARELLEKERDNARIDAELRFRRSPSVGRGLHELAEQIGAGLLVIGSSRRGPLGRVLLGDDTAAALSGAPCAVAIAPAGYAHDSVVMREIGVGYNGSSESEHALKVARALAAQHDAKLSAFEVVSVPSYALAGALAPLGDAIEELVKSARERVSALPGVEPHAAYGLPAEELALYSASLDLLVVGSHDYGPVGRLIHGSTSRRLARTARCPLLVLTRAARKADAADDRVRPGSTRPG
jgi:nucleotide-binding universal stress UspA family protein